MLELPEVVTIANQMRTKLLGQRVIKILPPSKPHKFCWFTGDPAEYHDKLGNAKIIDAHGFGSYVELVFDNGLKLCFNDGVNARLLHKNEPFKDYQLLVELAEYCLVFTVAMYGGITLFQTTDNKYYLTSKQALAPFSDAYRAYFAQQLSQCKPTMSIKAFLATEQRFPGIGNGVLQDILFQAALHPKRSIGTLTAANQERLFMSIREVLASMIQGGGRDTEKDLFGKTGGYRTKMSKNTLNGGCPKCGGVIVKENYLGGAIYYCSACQPKI